MKLFRTYTEKKKNIEKKRKKKKKSIWTEVIKTSNSELELRLRIGKLSKFETKFLARARATVSVSRYYGWKLPPNCQQTHLLEPWKNSGWRSNSSSSILFRAPSTNTGQTINETLTLYEFFSLTLSRAKQWNFPWILRREPSRTEIRIALHDISANY